MPSKFTLIGSELAGGLLAAYLGRQGHEIGLYQDRSDLRKANIIGRRSINVSLSARPRGRQFTGSLHLRVNGFTLFPAFLTS